MKRRNIICLSVILLILCAFNHGCSPAPEYTTIPNDTAPIVHASNHYYSMGDAAGFMYDAEDSPIWMNTVEWAISNRQSFIDSAVTKAEELQLNSENLQDILTKLVFNIDQLDFTGKNVSEDGEGVYPFRLSSQTVHIPYWIEKAEYKGQEAWLISLNWEKSDSINSAIGHIAVVVFEYGTDNVLFAMSCM